MQYRQDIHDMMVSTASESKVYSISDDSKNEDTTMLESGHGVPVNDFSVSAFYN